jgi:hypothetical protein
VKKPLFILFLFVSFAAQAQKISAADLKALRLKEDSLRANIKNVILDSFTAGRMRSDSQFVKTLVRSLQIKNSFYYPFDSLQGISKLYAPDSSFRIFSWSISFDDYYARQRAAIQYRTADGTLKLVPLRDFSEFTPQATDSMRTKDNWIGAVYYKIIKTEHNGKTYYTLFGFDDHSVRSNRKWIDVLSFDERDMPVFGAPFSFVNDSIKKPEQKRFYIEYKKEASTFVNYDPDLNLIIYDHLISESDEPEKPYTYIPDGDSEGFVWKGGKWVHIDKVFDFKLEDGQAPVPDPVRDNQGKNNEEKLQQQSNKNKAKKTGGR